MMQKIRLLDCTLRDGGYINNWNWGYECAKSIIRSLTNAHVDIVEAGRRLGTHLGFLCLRNGLAVRQGTDRVCSGRFRRGRLGPRRPLPAVAFDVFSGFGGFALPAHSHAGGGSKNGPCALQLY